MECPECGKSVSEKATDCPHCGASVDPASGGPGTAEGADDGGSNGTTDAGGSDSAEGVGQGPPAGDQPPTDRPPADEAPPGQQGGERPPQGQAHGGQGPQGPPPRGQQPQGQQSQGQQPQGQQSQGQPPQGQPAPGQAPQGQPPQGQPADGRPAQGQPAGAGPGGPGGPGGPPGAQGGQYGGGHGPGWEDRIRALPLRTGAILGAGAGVGMFVIGALLAIAYPSSMTSGDVSTLDLAVLSLFDIQFVPPSDTIYHLTPAMNDHFDEFTAPVGVFGLLYLLPALVLYRVGKLVVRLDGSDDRSLADSALAGASVVAGYLPIMLLAGVLAPSDPFEVDLVTVIFLPGLVYPLLFGAIGGLAGAYYYPGELRNGLGYALAVSVLSFVLVFLTTLVSVEDIPEPANELLGRLVTTFFATVGALTLNLNAGGVGLLPYLIPIGLFLGAGYLRVDRGPELRSAREAFASGATMTTTYVVLAGVLFSVAAIFASPYLQVEEMSDAYYVVSEAHDSDALGGDFYETFTSIGTFVENMVISTVFYPFLVGGAGGALAWWYENKDSQAAYQQQGQPPQQPRQ